MSINWYMSLYHKYRDYPIAHINTSYKRNQLKTIYENIFIRLSSYFYINISHQFQIKTSSQTESLLFDTKSNRKNGQNLSSGCSSMHSKFFQSNHLVMKKLKSQANDGDGIGDRSMASIKYFKEQDYAIDQFERARVESIGNFLKFLINTGKQILCSILIQSQITQKYSTCYFPDQQSNLQKSQAIKSQKVSESNTTCKNSQYKFQIAIEIIPENNQQINFYFLQFCSTVEVEDSQFWLNNLTKGRLESRQGLSNQVTLKDLMVSIPHPTKSSLNDLDEILLQIMGKELSFSNIYLGKFQYLTKNSKNTFNSKSSLNIIVETWLELVTMLQNQSTIYEIIRQLVKGNGNAFSQKISSYLHFICLINTKTLLAKTVSKQNFLSLLPDFLSGSRVLKDFNLDMNYNFIKIQDIQLDRQIYSSQAYKKVLQKWRHLGQIVSEILIQDDSIFWGKVLQSCCQLLDRYLQEKVELSYSLIVLYESLQQQESNTTIINISPWKRSYYQRAIKLIIQKQIGGIEPELSAVSRSQIRSKISLRKPTPFKSAYQINKPSFGCQNNHFVFYDKKTADRDEKILELRQWQKVVKQSIQQLKAYRRVLDTGLELFSGIPEYITIFFLQTYFNFKKVSVYASFNFTETVNKYCNKISTISYLKSINSNKQINPCPTKSILLELETHQQNYTQIYRQIANTFRSRQLAASPNLHPHFKQLSIISNNSYSGNNQRQKLAETDKNQYQSVFSQYQTNLSQGLIDGLPILGQDFVVGAVERMRMVDQQQCELTKIDDILTITQINKHLKLINQCNYIINTMEASSSSSSSAPTGSKSTPNTILILTTHQLTQSITKLAVEQSQHSKSLMMQTQYHRKTSNMSKNHRMSSNVMKKNERGPIQLDLGKIRTKIGLHNQCLELIVMGYCKYMQFYRLLIRNLGCLGCCGLAEDAITHNIDQVDKQKKYKQLAQKKLLISLKKYQQLHTKPTKQSYLEQFSSALQQELELTNINTQILNIFMYMSSLHIDNLTFSAIYKQDLISQEKMNKIKVIGKQYYQSIHQLYMRSNGGCGEFEPQAVDTRKSMYLENLLVVLVGLIELLYERSQEYVDMSAYTNLLRKYFTSKANIASKTEPTKINQSHINIHKIISQCFDWNEENIPELDEKSLIYQLLELRVKDESEEFSQQLRVIIQRQFKVLMKYENTSGRVEYLEKKLLYFMLREVYFDSYYDIGVFEIKSMQARKNFAMYEIKMVAFFQEIIEKDQQEFQLLKTEQLKQRSAHLKGYLVDYQKQPNIHSEQKNCLIKIVCILGKTLNLVTQNRQYQMKKRGSNSISLLRKNVKKSEPIYMHYVSTQLIKPNKQRVRVFQNQGYYFYRAIQIYEHMLCKKVEDSQKKFSIYKQLGFSVPTSVCVSFHDADFVTINENKDSILALWINYEYKSLHEMKMLLSHENYLSKIEKLYIDLDVRHKVFQSFKDKILNYQMQKTKIYHQYMDYIRGLKLDVYSHVSGQDPIPYFKLINAIKVYRLDVKKRELEQKIEEEFGKNLSKWNEGIVQDMSLYHEWITKQAKVWERMKEGTKKHKKQLFEIFTIVHKQLRKQQNKTIYMTQFSNKLKQNTRKQTPKFTNIHRSTQKKQSLYK